MDVQRLFRTPNLLFTLGVVLGLPFLHFVDRDHSVLNLKHALLISLGCWENVIVENVA